MRTYQFYDGSSIEFPLDGVDENFLVFPALIDPHVHFRTPGLEDKENWQTAAKAAIAGGYSTVFDMPNTLPPTNTAQRLRDKKAIIDGQLNDVDIPLRYQLFFGADKHHFDQIPLVKDEIIGIKVFMGCSTGNLVIDDDESLHTIFQIAGKYDLLVAVHAEDEGILKERKAKIVGRLDYAAHSNIRAPEAATVAVTKAIELSRLYGVRLYVLHVSTAEELELIRNAKDEGLPVFAETTPHHLFLNESAYVNLKGKAVVNPPLRTEQDRIAILSGIQDGTIDTIGSDHAPHTLSEKARPYGECPSGMPGIETTLPLLLTAYHQKLLTLAQIMRLTVFAPREIFRLKPTDDFIFVDMEREEMVTDTRLHTKCGWSSFQGMHLRGWPRFMYMKGRLYDLQQMLIPA